jgi:hypothetical protein
LPAGEENAVLVAAVFLLVLLVFAYGRIGAKDPPLDSDVIRRIRRHADQILREQRFPNE